MAFDPRDGELLPWIGKRLVALRDAGDVEAFDLLVRWIGFHASELVSVRNLGRWTTWPDDRDALL